MAGFRRKRGRPPLDRTSRIKRSRNEYYRRKVLIGDQLERWNDLRSQMGITHPQLAKILLDSSVYEHAVALFAFPRKVRQARMWHKFVLETRATWDKTVEEAVQAGSLICSDHFEETCFDKSALTRFSLGFTKVRLRLKPQSVPTLHKPYPQRYTEWLNNENENIQGKSAINNLERSDEPSTSLLPSASFHQASPTPSTSQYSVSLTSISQYSAGSSTSTSKRLTSPTLSTCQLNSERTLRLPSVALCHQVDASVQTTLTMAVMEELEKLVDLPGPEHEEHMECEGYAEGDVSDGGHEDEEAEQVYTSYCPSSVYESNPEKLQQMGIGQKRKPPGIVSTGLEVSGKRRKCIVRLPSCIISEPLSSLSDETGNNSGVGVISTNEDSCHVSACKQMRVTDLSNGASDCGNVHGGNGEACYIKQEVIQDLADESGDVRFLPTGDKIFLPTNFALECDEDVIEGNAVGSGTDESHVSEKPGKSTVCEKPLNTTIK